MSEKEWAFDRYRNGVRMAQGCRVHASTKDEAIQKAHQLFDHEDCTFVERTEPSPEPEAAPASEAHAPAAPERDYSEQAERDAEKLAEGYRSQHRFGDGPAWYAACVTACREVASLRERLATMSSRTIDAEEHVLRSLRDELARLRARVAILDAQEVELPELDAAYECQRDYGLSQPTGADYSIVESMARAQCRESQLLDALRAVQAWREASSTYRIEHRRAAENNFRRDCGCRRCKGYDALAGKGE